MTAPFSLPAVRGSASDASRIRHALLRRIHLRYATVTEPVRVGTVEFPFTRIAEPARVLEDIVEEESRRHERRADGTYLGQELRDGQEFREGQELCDDEPLHMPYWAELWDSAFGAAQALSKFAGASICKSPFVQSCPQPAESGCRRSDRSDPIGPGTAPLPFDRGASVQSGLHCASFLTTGRASLHGTSVLDLGCGMGLAGATAAALGAEVFLADLESNALLFVRVNTLPWRERCRVRRIDWRRDRLGRTFDLIVGADILYERMQWDFLEPFWRAHLSPGGAVLLAEPGRQTGELFPAWVGARRWLLDESAEQAPTRAKPIRIFRLTPSSPNR